MQKVQILFPDPLIARLRQLARRTDRPVSELVRRAAEEWVEKTAYLDGDPDRSDRPDLASLLFDGGEVRVPADEMKEILYGDH